MAAIRQILLVPLLAISVECIWTWPWLQNNFNHPQRNHLQLQNLPPLFQLLNLPHDDDIMFKSLLQKEISDFDVIIKRITVKKVPGFYEDEFFTGFSHDIIWLNNIPDKNTGNNDDDNQNGDDNNNSGDDNNHSGDDNNHSGNDNNHSDDDNNHSGDVNNHSGGINNDDSSNWGPNVSNNVSFVVGNQSNKKPFINNSKPDINANEDFKIDPRKDEVK